jgi:hypothetical protein
MQNVDGALRMSGGGEVRALVLLQHLEPMPEVRRVILSGLRRDAKSAAEESRTSFASSSRA